MADAVVSHLKNQNTVSITQFESITGKGAKAEIDGITYFIGNKRLIQENEILIENAVAQKPINGAMKPKQ